MKYGIVFFVVALSLCMAKVHSGEKAKVTIEPARKGSSLQVRAKKNSVLFFEGKREVASYRFGDVKYKPYVERLCTPAGRNILRDSPWDHVHHHSLMMAFAIDGCDFWSERGPQKNGIQRTDAVRAGVSNSRGWLETEITWTKTDNKPIVVEEREIAVTSVEDAPATLLRWRSKLRPAPGVKKATITGSHYFGLGMRFLQSMDKDGTFFFSKPGKSVNVRGDERVTPCRWAAYTARLDGKPVTVALFADPKNPRPLYAFTMGESGKPFAYLAGTINAWKEPLEITADQPVTLCWGVALFEGAVDQKTVEAEHARWLDIFRTPAGDP